MIVHSDGRIYCFSASGRAVYFCGTGVVISSVQHGVIGAEWCVCPCTRIIRYRSHADGWYGGRGVLVARMDILATTYLGSF